MINNKLKKILEELKEWGEDSVIDFVKWKIFVRFWREGRD